MKIVKFLLFGLFGKRILQSYTTNPFLSKRLKSVNTDFSYAMAISFPFLFLSAIPIFSGSYSGEILSNDVNNLFGKHLWISQIAFSFFITLMLNKDFFDGRSVIKRLSGYQVIDMKTKQVASPFQCMIRNITFIIWPTEVIILMINPSRRLGDFLAGTTVIETAPIPTESVLTSIEGTRFSGQMIIMLLGSFLLSILIVYLISPSTWIKYLIK